VKKLKWSRDKLHNYILSTPPMRYDFDLVRRAVDSMEEPLGYIAFKEQAKKKEKAKQA